MCARECPQRIIDMIPAKSPLQSWHWPRPEPRLAGVQLIATDALRRAG